MNIDDFFQTVTTLLVTKYNNTIIQSTGFFIIAESKGKESIWVATNRHVILPKVNDEEIILDEFNFGMRKKENTGITWEPAKLDSEQIRRRCKVHSNKDIDIAVIEIDDIVYESISTERLIKFYSIHDKDKPENTGIEPHAADDVVVIGYPRGYYDKKNVFPIVKSGIIASKWGANFNENPYFLIDAKLFPGSSGSLVISKPKSLMPSEAGMKLTSKEIYAFLGVFSGEPYRDQAPVVLDDMIITRRENYNLGIVWYYSIVFDIIENGVSIL